MRLRLFAAPLAAVVAPLVPSIPAAADSAPDVLAARAAATTPSNECSEADRHGDPRLGPADLPTRGPVGRELIGDKRTGNEAAWLEARAAAGELNTVPAGLGLHGDDQVRAQAGWSDDGRGVVYLRGTLSGARKLRSALYRMTERQVSGRAVCDSPEGRSVDD
ncbi:hypothetical protein PUR61_26280 [Streptomyces sp. BE20]|uniref:hypothetical protein n=1 Tax=Streptomyces sp. BE20 TaxID=3002525 RepID=UPI002E78D847|nr:hypothetical protein [Streptomyces sp. BE20]MEE1825669.1 hypothetical protein [Streptomyces sp. BE20]